MCDISYSNKQSAHGSLHFKLATDLSNTSQNSGHDQRIQTCDDGVLNENRQTCSVDLSLCLFSVEHVHFMTTFSLKTAVETRFIAKY